MKLTVTIPMSPSKRLRPNLRLHGRAKADDVAAARQVAFYAAREALAGMNTDGLPYVALPLFPDATPVQVNETVYWGKGERRVDLDAVPMMIKNMLDGIVDAGVMNNDSQVVRLVVTQAKAADGIGRTELVIESAA